jgi:hypothetical protein
LPADRALALAFFAEPGFAFSTFRAPLDVSAISGFLSPTVPWEGYLVSVGDQESSDRAAGTTRSTARQTVIDAVSRLVDPAVDQRAALAVRFAHRLDHAGATPLGDWLLDGAATDDEARAALADAIGLVARALAPDDRAPASGAAAATWQALVWAADRLHGSGVSALGRLPFIHDNLLARLRDESRQQQDAPPAPGRRTIGPAGDVLAGLAVSRQLRDAVTRALGCAAEPTYDAVYEYDGPGSCVHPHLDARGYPYVFHLILEHKGPRGSSTSHLVCHTPGPITPKVLPLRPGEAVVLRGRGTIHSWQAIGGEDYRTLVAVGFGPAT